MHPGLPWRMWIPPIAGHGTIGAQGSEGEGMRRLTRETCDVLVNIPMFGSVESLNVSVASGVCLYEARRQRGIQA